MKEYTDKGLEIYEKETQMLISTNSVHNDNQIPKPKKKFASEKNKHRSTNETKRCVNQPIGANVSNPLPRHLEGIHKGILKEIS
jgi:hypothetical protein